MIIMQNKTGVYLVTLLLVLVGTCTAKISCEDVSERDNDGTGCKFVCGSQEQQNELCLHVNTYTKLLLSDSKDTFTNGFKCEDGSGCTCLTNKGFATIDNPESKHDQCEQITPSCDLNWQVVNFAKCSQGDELKGSESCACEVNEAKAKAHFCNTDNKCHAANKVCSYKIVDGAASVMCPENNNPAKLKLDKAKNEYVFDQVTCDKNCGTNQKCDETQEGTCKCKAGFVNSVDSSALECKSLAKIEEECNEKCVNGDSLGECHIQDKTKPWEFECRCKDTQGENTTCGSKATCQQHQTDKKKPPVCKCNGDHKIDYIDDQSCDKCMTGWIKQTGSEECKRRSTCDDLNCSEEHTCIKSKSSDTDDYCKPNCQTDDVLTSWHAVCDGKTGQLTCQEGYQEQKVATDDKTKTKRESSDIEVKAEITCTEKTSQATMYYLIAIVAAVAIIMGVIMFLNARRNATHTPGTAEP